MAFDWNGGYPSVRWLCCWLLLSPLLLQPVVASQVKFERNEENGAVNLSYIWLDAAQSENSWSFSLPESALNSVMSKFKVYQPSIALQKAYIAVSKAVNNYDPRQVRIKITRLPNTLDITTSSRQAGYAGQVRGELYRVADEARQAYLASNYYTAYAGPMGGEGVIPDHQRVTAESVELLKPLGQQLQAKFPNVAAKIVANWLLPFVQSIPYETQDARLSSAGVGFLTPPQVLDQNRGDCDSKVTLMASLMRALYPTLDMVIIYLPEHALLGINVPRSNADRTLTIGGTSYVLADVAGPALMPLGRLAPGSLALIAGAYGYKRL